MSEIRQNVWAPWRMEYIHSLGAEQGRGCFLCRHAADPDADARNHVLRRGALTFTVLNRFPYSSGHLLIAPTVHEGRIEALSEDVLLELMRGVRDAKRMLDVAMHPQGFNIGLNLGHCAGAGLPDHLHWHVVPRWGGDTNFMPILGGVTVIPEALDRTYEHLRDAARQLGL